MSKDQIFSSFIEIIDDLEDQGQDQKAFQFALEMIEIVFKNKEYLEKTIPESKSYSQQGKKRLRLS